MDTAYGVVTDIEKLTVMLTLSTSDPKTITSITDTLEIGSRWEQAMENYVVATEARDDLDTQYQAAGATALQLYDRELSVAKLHLLETAPGLHTVSNKLQWRLRRSSV